MILLCFHPGNRSTFHSTSIRKSGWRTLSRLTRTIFLEKFFKVPRIWALKIAGPPFPLGWILDSRLLSRLPLALPRLGAPEQEIGRQRPSCPRIGGRHLVFCPLIGRFRPLRPPAERAGALGLGLRAKTRNQVGRYVEHTLSREARAPCGDRVAVSKGFMP